MNSEDLLRESINRAIHEIESLAVASDEDAETHRKKNKRRSIVRCEERAFWLRWAKDKIVSAIKQ